jgi:hypothetical protein
MAVEFSWSPWGDLGTVANGDLQTSAGESDKQDRKVALVILVCAITFSLFIVDPGRARAIAVCVGVFGTTIWTRQHLRRKVWFWIVLVVLAALHLPLIFLVRWSDVSLPAYGLIPITLVDYAFVCGPIWLIEEALSRESKIS